MRVRCEESRVDSTTDIVFLDKWDPLLENWEYSSRNLRLAGVDSFDVEEGHSSLVMDIRNNLLTNR